MPVARLECLRQLGNEESLALSGHALIVMSAAKSLPDALPARDVLAATLQRRQLKPAELAKTAVAVNLPSGALLVYVMVDATLATFKRLTVLRKAAMLLLDESPRQVAVLIAADGDDKTVFAQQAAYVLLVNGAPLPQQKKKRSKALREIRLYGGMSSRDFTAVVALARANHRARELTALPPNQLSPKSYRERLRVQAQAAGWAHEEYDLARLKKLGAGAFLAVARGSPDKMAAIVRLSWRPKAPRGRVALVGKGICFDTGGHNLKPARYMAGMHEDMNGSAVVLAILQAATELNLPIAIDAWLAISRNDISPQAYHQNEIVTAINGTTIEVVHTDAEGRMVLADTLALATRAKGNLRPDLVVDFATLTGSMHTAIGTRYSGIFSSQTELLALATGAGEASGERVCAFPMDEDYAEALESKVADIKQCTLEGEADHILAACFLRRFSSDLPWLHVDLSACNCSGGLGGVAGPLTGFGVSWGIRLLTDWLSLTRPPNSNL